MNEKPGMSNLRKPSVAKSRPIPSEREGEITISVKVKRDVLMKIKKQADANFRNVRNQAAFILTNGVLHQDAN